MATRTAKKKSSPLRFVISIVIEPDADGYYAYCPALKGLHTCGATEGEAIENAKNAATAYIRSLIKHGDPIPVGLVMNGEHDHVGRRRSQRQHVIVAAV
jgi:predicted RNase H-like HicB family nuclease